MMSIEKNQPVFKKIIDELSRVVKRKEPNSTFIYFALEEVIPEIFKDREKIELAYKNNKKYVDYISRHLI